MLSWVIISMQLDDQQAVSAALARSIVESAASSDQPHVSQESNAFDPQYSRVLAAISAPVHHLFCPYPRPSADLLVCVRVKKCHSVILCFVCSSMHDNPFYTTCIMLGRSGIELGDRSLCILSLMRDGVGLFQSALVQGEYGVGDRWDTLVCTCSQSRTPRFGWSASVHGFLCRVADQCYLAKMQGDVCCVQGCCGCQHLSDALMFLMDGAVD